MIKRAFLAVIALAGMGVLPLLSQTEPDLRPRNAAYVELGGAALLGSLNYQRNFLFSKRGHVSARIGFFYAGNNEALLPVSLFYSFEGISTFLLGAGYTASSPKISYPTIHLIGGFKVPIRNNMFIQILATPFYPLNPKTHDLLFWPWAGISLGWDF